MRKQAGFVILKDGKVLDRKYGLDKTMDAKDFFRQWIRTVLLQTSNATSNQKTNE